MSNQTQFSGCPAGWNERQLCIWRTNIAPSTRLKAPETGNTSAIETTDLSRIIYGLHMENLWIIYG